MSSNTVGAAADASLRRFRDVFAAEHIRSLAFVPLLSHRGAVGGGRAARVRGTAFRRVSDIAMPDRDGYWLIERIRRTVGSATPAPPIIALTAFASPEAERRAQEAGFSDHLAKPVDTERLVRSIHRLAASSRSA